MRAQRGQGRAGFGLVDVCVALVILASSLGVLVGTVFSSMRLARSNEATTAANQAMRSVLARFNALNAMQVFAICNGDASDDIDGETSAEYLGVPGSLLTDRDGAALTVTVSFPTDPGAPGVIREDLDLPLLGLPRDLNGDGAIDSGNHTDDFQTLPVLLSLDWDGASGTQHVQMATLLRRN